MIRKAQLWDIPAIRQIHERAGYNFPFPAIEEMVVSYVIEEEGKPVLWIGAELEAAIHMIADPEWGSPHTRMQTFAALHLPVARQLKKLKVRNANIHLDQKFPRFGHRVSQLGWHKALWEHYFMSVDECLNALEKRVS